MSTSNRSSRKLPSTPTTKPAHSYPIDPCHGCPPGPSGAKNGGEPGPAGKGVIPGSVLFLPAAEEDLFELDRSRQIKVFKALWKIAAHPVHIGKPLENQAGRPLSGFRSVYVDKKSVRIVWKAASHGRVEIVLVAGIATRDRMYVYELVSRRRGEVERLIRQLGTSDDLGHTR